MPRNQLSPQQYFEQTAEALVRRHRPYALQGRGFKSAAAELIYEALDKQFSAIASQRGVTLYPPSVEAIRRWFYDGVPGWVVAFI